MEIKINKEIKEYNETMFFGLSVRQFICAILACGAAVGIYFGCRSFMGTETLSWLCMLGAAPFAALGFIRYKHVPEVCKALKQLGYSVRLKTKEGDLYVFPAKEKKPKETDAR